MPFISNFLHLEEQVSWLNQTKYPISSFASYVNSVWGFFTVMIKYIATTFHKRMSIEMLSSCYHLIFQYGISLQYRLYIDPPVSGLVRCGKSCRLRWLNYLRPNIKRGNYSKEEEETIIRLHESQGNRYLSIGCSFQPGWNLNMLFICCGSYD